MMEVLQGVDVYVLYVCVYAHTHTLHVGYSDVSPGVGTRHLESVIVYIYTVRCTKYTCIYICWATGRSLD